MLNAISNATPAQPLAQTTATSSPKSTQSKSQPAATSATTDTVQLSAAAQAALAAAQAALAAAQAALAAAQAALAAAQEAKETPAQTAQEANGGDRQAERLLAKEAAARPSVK